MRIGAYKSALRREAMVIYGSLWRKARSFNALQWRILVFALVGLPVIDLSLRILGFQRTRAWLTRASDTTAYAQTDSVTKGAAIARAVSAAARYSPWRTSCLRQALFLWLVLRVRGIESQIRVGIAGTSRHDFSAHAWLEHEGHVLIGGENARANYEVIA